MLAVVETEGNPACHVILRGANSGPNYEAEHVKKAAEGLKKAGVSTRVMIDWYVPRGRRGFCTGLDTRTCADMDNRCGIYSSHGNSKKKHENQVLVAEDVARQLSSPETADNIMGVMVRSAILLKQGGRGFLGVLGSDDPWMVNSQIESNLVAGKQSIPASGPQTLTYGQSVTSVLARLLRSPTPLNSFDLI